MDPSTSGAPSITNLPDPNIDGGWGWMVVFSTFMIHVISDGIMFSYGVFFAEIRDYFDTTSALAALVMSIFIGISCCSGPIASGLINKYGCRVVSILGTLISCVGFLISLLVPSVEYLLATTGVLAGIGFGLIYLPTIVGVALHFEKKRATAMGISMAGSGIGSMIFAPLIEWLIIYYHYWKGAMIIITGLLMNCFVLSCFYRQFGPVEEVIIPAEEIDEPASDGFDSFGLPFLKLATSEPSRQLAGATSSFYLRRPSVASNEPGLMQKTDILFPGSSTPSSEASGTFPEAPPAVPSSVSSLTAEREPCLSFTKATSEMLGLSLFKNYAFLIFFIGSFLQCFGLDVPVVFLYDRAIELEIADGTEASLLLSTMGITNTIGKVLFGVWADRTRFSKLSIYIIVLLINGIAAVLTAFVTQYYQMAFYSALVGITYGGSASLSSIVLVDLLGMEKLNNAYGLYLLSAGVAISVGTPLAGMLHDSSGNYDISFYLSGGATILGSLLLFLIPVVQREFPQ